MSNKLTIYLAGRMGGLTKIEYNTWREMLKKKLEIAAECCNSIIQVINPADYFDTKIATQAHSFRCGLVAQQYKSFNKLNYIFNFTMKIFTYAV